jgi:hypothetical protein
MVNRLRGGLGMADHHDDRGIVGWLKSMDTIREHMPNKGLA